MLEKKWTLNGLGSALGLIICLFLLTNTIGGTAVASDNEVSIANPKEVPLGSVRKLPRWAKTVARHRAALRRDRRACAMSGREGCARSEWQKRLDALRAVPAADRLKAVNDMVNRVAYRDDIELYGVADHWAAPSEFFRRGGDCEDYVIAKYLLLRALGVPAEAMRMVVVWDRYRNIAHAVLVVTQGGKRIVLDNAERRASVAEENGRYRPLYSFNERRMWVHTKRKG